MILILFFDGNTGVLSNGTRGTFHAIRTERDRKAGVFIFVQQAEKNKNVKGWGGQNLSVLRVLPPSKPRVAQSEISKTDANLQVGNSGGVVLGTGTGNRIRGKYFNTYC